MKTCRKCGKTKPIAEFGTNRARPDGVQTQCKPCRKVTNAESYTRTKGYQNPKRAASKAVHVARNQDIILNYLLEHPCVDCGEADIVVLQFDHQGDKVCDVSTLRGSSSERLMNEILKCEVVCANCHVRRTARTFSWWRVRATAL